MSTQPQEPVTVAGSQDRVTESRTTPPGTSTQRELARMYQRRSTRLGLLFFLQHQGRLTPGQHLYLMKEQDNVKLEELDAALALFRKLVMSRRSAARAHSELEYVLRRCPSLASKSVQREQRRIGVGYRDKGSLAPEHGQRLQPRAWWSEDIAPALWNPPETPTWLTTGEVFAGPSDLRHIQELALLQMLNNSPSHYTDPTR